MIVNVSDLLRDAAVRDPEGVALVEHRPHRREMTWSELDLAADAVARGLSARGLVAGHRVAVVMANRIDLPVAYFGILRGGMVAVPINPRSTTSEIARMLADSRARVVLSDESGAPQVREAVGPEDEHPSIVVDGTSARAGETSFEAFLDEASGTAPAAPPDPETLAVVLYTLSLGICRSLCSEALLLRPGSGDDARHESGTSALGAAVWIGSLALLLTLLGGS